MKKLTLILAAIIFASPCLMAAPHAFPVPYKAKEHSSIFFKNLPGSGTIKIYTVVGEKVIEMHIPSGQSMYEWVGVKNASGQKVASGVYLYRIDASGQRTTGKLVVIR